MPIRFKCKHCGQTLNVASKYAGAKAKCPKCHEALVIPTPPAASGGASPTKKEAPTAQKEKESTPSASPSTGQLPSATSDSAPIDSVATSLPAAAAAPAPSTPGPATPAASDDPFAQFAVYDDTGWVYEDEHLGNGRLIDYSKVDPNRVAISRSVLYVQGALLVVVALVAFGFGLFIGGSGHQTEQVQQPRPAIIEGRVRYAGVDAATSADDGCVIIALPQGEGPKPKWSIEGFRPNEPMPPADHPVLSQIHKLGGGYARAGLDGSFELEVPESGMYYVLILSRNARHGTADKINYDDLAAVGRYFEDTDELLSKYCYDWSLQRVKGSAYIDKIFK